VARGIADDNPANKHSVSIQLVTRIHTNAVTIITEKNGFLRGKVSYVRLLFVAGNTYLIVVALTNFA
jgi:hypothetical protein